MIARANDNRARAKGGRHRFIPVSGELMRLYADYLTREYGSLDSDYVFVNLWSRPYGRPWTYAAVYDLVLSLDPPMILKAGRHSPRSSPVFSSREAALTRCGRKQRRSGR